MVLICIDPCLQLEKFNENKKKNILTKYKDMRIKAASELKKMWFNLGDKKQQFIPNMVEPFMMVALIPIPEIHNTIIPLFFDMINCEYFNKGLIIFNLLSSKFLNYLLLLQNSKCGCSIRI